MASAPATDHPRHREPLSDTVRPSTAAPTEDVDAPARYRAAPHNTEAEQALLGALLVNNAAYQRVAEFLLPEHLYNPAHQRIFAAIAKLIERGQIADPATLRLYFEQDEALADVGGALYLGRLAASVITIINAADYGRTIHDAYLRRQLIEIGTETVNDAAEPQIDVDARALIEQAEQSLFDLAVRGILGGGFQAFVHSVRGAARAAEQAYQRAGRTSGIATGFRDIDQLLGGLHPSDLVIVAGRPSMGKTAFATNIAFNAAAAFAAGRGPGGEFVAVDGAVVGFFSLEMSAEQLATRLLAQESGVSGDRIRRGAVAHEEFQAFLRASTRLESLPLHIDDTPALTISAVRTRARRLKRQHGLHLVVVDYLQLLQGPPRHGVATNRVQEITDITRGLKALAKELEVPVVALSQLSRAVEQREDKRPLLADLRESGSIEQDADVVMFVYREEYYLGRVEPGRRPDESEERFNQRHADWWQRLNQVAGIGEIIIAKQRHGPIGTVKLRFDGTVTRFGDHDG